MRKFGIRWWVSDPWERYRREVEALTGEAGVSIRYHADYNSDDGYFRQTVSFWFQKCK